MATEATKKQFFLGTYGGLTAESILAYANVHLSRDDLKMQLAATDSFYAELIHVPTLVVINSLLNGQCRDIQSYSQERMIEYILSGVEYKMTTEADIALKEKIEKERLALIQLGTDLNELETAHYDFMLAVYVQQEKQAARWLDEIEKLAENLWEDIEQCNPKMPPEAKETLLHYLITQAATIVLSDKEVRSSKIKTDPLAAQKAVIHLFSENKASICPNVIETSQKVEEEMRKLQKEFAQERELLLTTVEKMKVAILEKCNEFVDKRNIINKLFSEVDENVNAFKPSEDTINNNLNMNSLEDLGLVKS
jgi:hypothetical protein